MRRGRECAIFTLAHNRLETVFGPIERGDERGAQRTPLDEGAQAVQVHLGLRRRDHPVTVGPFRSRGSRISRAGYRCGNPITPPGAADFYRATGLVQWAGCGQRRWTNDWPRYRGQKTLTRNSWRCTGKWKDRPTFPRASSTCSAVQPLANNTTALIRLASSCDVPHLVEQVRRPGGCSQAWERSHIPSQGIAPDSSTRTSDEVRCKKNVSETMG